MALYTGELNEFIDWISNKDYITKRSAISQDDNISGGSIRRLLQEHLRKPFYVYEDTDNNMKYLFSSEESKIRYFRALESVGNDKNQLQQEYKDLVLLEFNIPAPYKVYCVDASGDALKTINILNGSARRLIEFKVYIDELNSGYRSSFEVKYTLMNNTNQILFEDLRTYDSEYSDGQHVIQFDCFDYLQVGTNKLQLTIKLTDGQYNADVINPTITINVINYNINGEFANLRWYDPIPVGSQNLPLVIDIDRSISTAVSQKLEYYIDDLTQAKGSKEQNIEGTSSSIQLNIDKRHIENLMFPHEATSEEIENGITNDITLQPKHYLLIKGNMKTVDNSINFDSNSLLYEFVTISDEQEELNNHYINIRYSIPAGALETENGIEEICLIGNQYEEFVLNWTYYTLNMGDSSVNIDWELQKIDNDNPSNNETIHLSTLSGYSGSAGETLRFIPDKPYLKEENWHLVANVIAISGTYYKIFDRQIIVNKSAYDFEFDEAPGCYFKLNAYGRSNTETEASRKSWIPTGNITQAQNIPETEFSASIPWDNLNGWTNNGLSLSGEQNYGIIKFNAFPLGSENSNGIAKFGRTIELDFMTGSVSNENDPLIIIGNLGENNRTGQAGPAIYVYPTKAVLYNGDSEIIKTNYKVNERIQLTFIFEPNKEEMSQMGLSQDIIKEINISSKNVYIVNNGILERGALLDNQVIGNTNGQIKFGGTDSSIIIYNIRLWWKTMTIFNSFKNFLFDTTNKAKYIIRNSIIKGNEIDYQSCVSKIDTILISGNLSTVLTAGAKKDESETAVDILYTTPNDKRVLGFDAKKIMIRKHGQSTLNYPIASFKFWLNKTKGENVATVEFNDGVKNMQLVKNRYPINVGSIPANKYVLQANYADSSGVHNGGLLRLINDTWYNAPFNVKDEYGTRVEYKLRTSPQLFSSNQTVRHNNVKLGEVNESEWIDGFGNNPEFTINGLNATEHTWGELKASLTENPQNTSFPYKIRNAPDSRPCVVFYTDTSKPASSLTKKFLGQFVLMDDKKADHIFGERSIYLWGDGKDPFCMTVEGATTEVINKKGNKKKGYDIDDNCVWDNGNVLRIECVLINTPLTSFMNFMVPNDIQLDEDGNTSTEQEFTSENSAADIKYETDPKTGEYILDNTGNKIPLNYYWEDYFEMIFPDGDDIDEDDASKGRTKFDGRYKNDGESDFVTNTSKFIQKTQPWIDFLKWICSVGQLNKDNGGNYYVDGTVTTAALNKFKAEAHDHLDLYKLAAYYIFYIRFGLVDSVERNAQYKTYDGIHWFLEPWDMDIALGNKNTGGLAFDPPMNRETLLDPTKGLYAYSGRSVSTSNILWDCLEAWDVWRDEIVPEVAQALYEGGLTYEKITEVFDDEFVNKWSEIIYNESGLYKYVEKAQEASWLAWLQGARTSHRHWWISTSMNYYDSKWTCGQFNSSRIYLAVDKPQGTAATIKIIPTTESYFKLTQMDTTLSRGLQKATKQNPATWIADNWSFSAKDPAHLFGALFMEKIDLGNFGQGLQVLSFQNAVDTTLGATIKELSIGSKLPDNINSINSFTGWVNTVKPNITNSASSTSIENDESIDALENIITYNITGQLGLTSADIITSNRSKLKNIYAIGSGFTTLTSSTLGNNYDNLYLPGETIVIDTNNESTTRNGVTSINVINTKWENITFWSTTYHQSSTQTVLYVDDENNPILDDEGHEIYISKPTVSTFNRMTRIPKNFNTISFKGSTATNSCSIRFILDWFNSIEYYVSQENPGLTGDELENKVLEYISTNCKAVIENIRWNYGKSIGNPDYISITYKDVVRLGYLNGAPDEEGHGVNYKSGSNLNGYIKIEGDRMTSSQLSRLTNLFGENVFNINSTGMNVVIDQESTYAQISVSGAIRIENDDIVSDEGVKIKFKCTSFLLSSENVDDYIWSASNVLGHTFTSSAGGFTKDLILEQTTKTERYVITVTAQKRTNASINASVNIIINPTITARDFKWNVITSNSPVRKFICNELTARAMFGNNNTTSNGELRDIFIIPSSNLNTEFSIDTESQFNANIKKIKIKFSEITDLQSIPSIKLSRDAKSGYDCDILSDNDNEQIDITDDINGLINIDKNADSYVNQTRKIVNGKLTGVRNSINLISGNSSIFNTECQDMKYFALHAEIIYDSQSIGTHTYSCNIILYDDSTTILTTAHKSFEPILRKLKEYNESYYTGKVALFKSDLNVLSGKLDFKDNNGQLIDMQNDQGAFIAANTGASIFDYMSNINELNLSGLAFNFGANYNINFFNMNKLKSLEILNISNCTAATNTFTIENSSTLRVINFGGTCPGDLICKNNIALETISLGKPSKVFIERCPLLSAANVTINDNSLLMSIDLKSTSTDNLIMYKILNKLL